MRMVSVTGAVVVVGGVVDVVDGVVVVVGVVVVGVVVVVVEFDVVGEVAVNVVVSFEEIFNGGSVRVIVSTAGGDPRSGHDTFTCAEVAPFVKDTVLIQAQAQLPFVPE